MLLCGCLIAYSTLSWITFFTVEEEVINKAAKNQKKKRKKRKKEKEKEKEKKKKKRKRKRRKENNKNMFNGMHSRIS